MKFAIARSPMSPTSPIAFCLRWGLVAVLIVLATSQLILFEKFVPFIDSFRMFDAPSFGDVFAAGMVVGEVMSLPFLLRMNLSPLMRIVSACSLVFTGLVWVILGYWSSIRPYNNGGSVAELFLSYTNNIIMPFGISLIIIIGFILFCLRADFKA